MMVATCISHDEAILPKIIDHSGNLTSHCHIVLVQGAHSYHQMKTIRDSISNTKLLLSFPSFLLEKKSRFSWQRGIGSFDMIDITQIDIYRFLHSE